MTTEVKPFEEKVETACIQSINEEYRWLNTTLDYRYQFLRMKLKN
jgi:hypothetical protein